MNRGEADRAALTDWWRDAAEIEINATIPKAVEYGSGDLAEIGRTMNRVLGRTGPGMSGEPSEAEATELGIWFYLVGKMARWEQAIKDGRKVSDDTLFDIGVYIRMVQRTRDVGGWPWGAATPEGEF